MKLIIDEIAIPLDDKLVKDEMMPMDLRIVLEYYKTYLSHCHFGEKVAKNPAEYLNQILAITFSNGENRSKCLESYGFHYGYTLTRELDGLWNSYRSYTGEEC